MTLKLIQKYYRFKPILIPQNKLVIYVFEPLHEGFFSIVLNKKRWDFHPPLSERKYSVFWTTILSNSNSTELLFDQKSIIILIFELSSFKTTTNKLNFSQFSNQRPSQLNYIKDMLTQVIYRGCLSPKNLIVITFCFESCHWKWSCAEVPL